MVGRTRSHFVFQRRGHHSSQAAQRGMALRHHGRPREHYDAGTRVSHARAARFFRRNRRADGSSERHDGQRAEPRMQHHRNSESHADDADQETSQHRRNAPRNVAAQNVRHEIGECQPVSASQRHRAPANCEIPVAGRIPRRRDNYRGRRHWRLHVSYQIRHGAGLYVFADGAEHRQAR